MMTMTTSAMKAVTCLLLMASSGLLPMATLAHVCENRSYGYHVCDPATQGSKYFICNGQGQAKAHMPCPGGLKFYNSLGVCNWLTAGYECSGGDQSSTAASTTPTTTTTTPTTTTTTTPNPTTTTTTTTPATTSSGSTSTTSASNSGTWTDPCAGVANGGYICDPETNGTSFLRCVNGQPHKFYCSGGTYFDKAKNTCDWPGNIAEMCVAGGGGGAGTGSTTTGTTTTTTTTTTAPLPSGPCNNSVNCQLPSCRCLGTDVPGGIPLDQVPKMILVTFDDAITQDNFQNYYAELFPENAESALKNPNGCRTAATFFVSGLSYTSMPLVRKLWERGNEIASHSKTHGSSSNWNKAMWKDEMQGMREQLATALSANVSEVAGMRVPFLELGKETQFQMMRENGFVYDSTMYGGPLSLAAAALPYWPFTLDYPPTQSVCDHFNCPDASHPGVWEVPIIRQYNLQGAACSMTDACDVPDDAGAVKEFLLQNYQRHIATGTNRAPFMVSLHATWFSMISRLQGLKLFLNQTNADQDVWQVTLTQMLDWVRDPKPLNQVTELPSWNAC